MPGAKDSRPLFRPQKEVVDFIIAQYKAALATRGDTSYNNIGMALHPLQDSFSPSHTVRTMVNGKPGPIAQFQNYEKQVAKSHKEGDNAFNPRNAGHAFAAESATTKLLKMYRAKTPPDAVRNWLLKGPFALAKICKCGGSAPEYAIPKLDDREPGPWRDGYRFE